MIECPITEKAKATLGKDFLGVEAVQAMENKLRAVGVEVEFVIDERLEALRPVEGELRKLRAIGIVDWKITTEEPIPAFPYNDLDLEFATIDKEMLVVRPQAMRIEGKETPLTLRNFANLFYKDPTNRLMDLFDRGVYHRLGASSVWYRRDYANQEGTMAPGWALATKEIIPATAKLTTEEQVGKLQLRADRLKAMGAANYNVRQRTALEIAYDTMLYYVNNGGETLLYSNLDRSQTQDEYGGRVVMGYFRHNIGASGLRIQSWKSDTTDSPFGDIGVCSTR